jgi:uncharacterized membrane protein
MIPSTNEHAVVAIYDTHEAAEGAVKALEKAGLDLKHLSIVGTEYRTEEQAIGFYSAGDRMKVWGARGAFWGGLYGMLFGGAFFLIPALGPIFVMGPLVGWLVGALEGAVVGGTAGIFGAALASVGIPEDAVVRYELAVKAGKFLVLVRGSGEMIEHAHAALAATGAAELTKHAS